MSKKHLHLKVEQLSEGNALPLELVWRGSGRGSLGAFGMVALFLVLAFTIGDMIPEAAFGEYTALVKKVLPVALIVIALLRLFRALVLWKTENRVEVDGCTVFGGAALGIWYLQRKNPNRITIMSEEIRRHDRLVQRRSFVMPLSEIESITIRDRDSESAHGRTLKLSGKELLLSTDRTERATGAGLNADELEWLRGYLVAAIARA